MASSPSRSFGGAGGGTVFQRFQKDLEKVLENTTAAAPPRQQRVKSNKRRRRRRKLKQRQQPTGKPPLEEDVNVARQPRQPQQQRQPHQQAAGTLAQVEPLTAGSSESVKSWRQGPSTNNILFAPPSPLQRNPRSAFNVAAPVSLASSHATNSAWYDGDDNGGDADSTCLVPDRVQPTASRASSTSVPAAVGPPITPPSTPPAARGRVTVTPTQRTSRSPSQASGRAAVSPSIPPRPRSVTWESSKGPLRSSSRARSSRPTTASTTAASNASQPWYKRQGLHRHTGAPRRTMALPRTPATKQRRPQTAPPVRPNRFVHRPTTTATAATATTAATTADAAAAVAITQPALRRAPVVQGSADRWLDNQLRSIARDLGVSQQQAGSQRGASVAATPSEPHANLQSVLHQQQQLVQDALTGWLADGAAEGEVGPEKDAPAISSTSAAGPVPAFTVPGGSITITAPPQSRRSSSASGGGGGGDNRSVTLSTAAVDDNSSTSSALWHEEQLSSRALSPRSAELRRQQRHRRAIAIQAFNELLRGRHKRSQSTAAGAAGGEGSGSPAGAGGELQKRMTFAGLKWCGLDRPRLENYGLREAQIDRLYRSLFVYTEGFHELLTSGTLGTVPPPELLSSVWQAYALLMEARGRDTPTYATALSQLVTACRQGLVKVRDEFASVTLGMQHDMRHLSEENERLRAALQQAQDANRRLEAENSVIQTEAKELQARNTAMGAEMDAMIVLRDALKQDAATATAALTKAQVELATVRYREPALTAQLRTSRDNNVKLKALLQSAEATNEVLRSLVHAPHENQAAAWRAFTQHATATAHLIKSLESNRHGGDTGGVPGRDQFGTQELESPHHGISALVEEQREELYALTAQAADLRRRLASTEARLVRSTRECGELRGKLREVQVEARLSQQQRTERRRYGGGARAKAVVAKDVVEVAEPEAPEQEDDDEEQEEQEEGVGEEGALQGLQAVLSATHKRHTTRISKLMPAANPHRRRTRRQSQRRRM